MDNPMEQKAQHTPGPWVVDTTEVWKEDGTSAIDAEEWGALARVVVQIENEDGLNEEGVANARLIAAAPDLLPIAGIVAALPIQADVADDVPLFGLDGAYITHGDVRNARAAIAKAKGNHRMTQTPDEVMLAPNGGLPTANYPKAELVKFIRATPAREAAPDLLAALEMALDYMGFHNGEYDCQDQLDLINAAIAKAKGTSL